MTQRDESTAVENTDREIWRGPDEGNGSFYADSLHITKQGGLGIDCGGMVYVKPIREWHHLAASPSGGAVREALELAYGLLWVVGCDRATLGGNALYLARKALLEQLDKAGQGRGITAARKVLNDEDAASGARYRVCCPADFYTLPRAGSGTSDASIGGGASGSLAALRDDGDSEGAASADGLIGEQQCGNTTASSMSAAMSSDQLTSIRSSSTLTAHVTELPENVRIPLNSLQADLGYLIGRVIADGSCGPMIQQSIAGRLNQIEEAVKDNSAAIDALVPADGVRMPLFLTDEQADAALRATAVWLDVKGSQLTVNREKMKARYTSLVRFINAQAKTETIHTENGQPDEASSQSQISSEYAGRKTYRQDEVTQALAQTEAPSEATPASADELANLVSRFSAALLEKLRAAEEKYRWGDGWLEDGWQESCLTQFKEHCQKGDPRDVAAYCAFMWHHGWSTCSPGLNAAAIIDPVESVGMRGAMRQAMDDHKSMWPAPADDAAVAWPWPKSLLVRRHDRNRWHGDISFARCPTDAEIETLAAFLNTHHENTHPAKAVDVEAIARIIDNAAFVIVNAKHPEIRDRQAAARGRAMQIAALLTTAHASSETEGGR